MTADPRKERETRLRGSDSGLGDPDRQRESGAGSGGRREGAGRAQGQGRQHPAQRAWQNTEH